MRARISAMLAIVLVAGACADHGPSAPAAVPSMATSTVPSASASTVPSASALVPSAPICLDDTPTWLATATNANDGVPDPDGRILVGQVNRFDPVIGQHIAPLLSMDADGSDVVEIFNCELGRPRFSPDGSRIAFSLAMSDGTWQVATIAADGSDLRILTSTAGYAQTPDWSPDGTWLVFANSPEPCPPAPTCDWLDASLWRMNADGSDQRQLSARPASSDDYEPRISPDGTEVVFAREALQDDWRWTPMILDLASRDERLVKDDARDLEHPDWSPDGRSIVYNQSPSGPIERVPSDDPAAPAVVLAGDSAHSAFKPAYSPDGSSIVFGCDGAVCRMNDDGSDVQVLLAVPGVEFNHFDWGPPSSPG